MFHLLKLLTKTERAYGVLDLFSLEKRDVMGLFDVVMAFFIVFTLCRCVIVVSEDLLGVL